VNCVCPGFTDTDLLTGSMESVAAKTGRTIEDLRATVMRANPQGRFVRPEEVAAAVLFLCGPGSDAMTGQAIAVAGGEVT
jgi:NAD(P)-dependent dehydrogenase (short-subunit alcohol dehydrogenase family)